MANPSTVWAQLAIPFPAAGSIPFVANDNATIVTDVQNLSYDPVRQGLDLTNQIVFGYTAVPLSTIATVTCNTATGRVVIGPGIGNILVLNSNMTANTIVIPVLESTDATATSIKSCTPVNIAGQTGFRIITNAISTTQISIAFMLVN